MKTPPRAFTLIELLVVVAVIAILAAIAVPNFLEAQTRSKVSRVKADHRSLSTAVEAYRVDWNQYPLISSGSLNTYIDPASAYHQYKAYRVLSTPIAYITNSMIADPFRVPGAAQQVKLDSRIYQYAHGYHQYPPDFLALSSDQRRQLLEDDPRSAFPADVYALVSFGPDDQDDTLIIMYPYSEGIPYDPTNGTVSGGDIFRCGPSNLVPNGWQGKPIDPPY